MNEELIRQVARFIASEIVKQNPMLQLDDDGCGYFDDYDNKAYDCLTVARAVLSAHVAPLVEAVEALGAMPEGFCFCSQERVGDDSKEHEVECADVRKALAPFQNETSND